MQVDFEDIYTEGISKITDIDIRYAKAMGARIKLFASSVKENDEHVYAMVAPVLIKANHPLYSVNDVFNGIFVRGNVIGDVMFYGSGAGKLPTASAVVADIVDAAKHLSKNIWTIWSSKKLELTDINQVKHRFFIRVQANDLAVKEHISKLFQDVEEITTEGITGEYAFLTQNISEQELKEKQNKLDGILSVIRVRF
jgi:homoserine dehydrogenase